MFYFSVVTALVYMITCFFVQMEFIDGRVVFKYTSHLAHTDIYSLSSHLRLLLVDNYLWNVKVVCVLDTLNQGPLVKYSS